MTNYTVHIYREMRLVYEGIDADTPEAAASIARDKPTSEADGIDDCEGENLSALVDVQGDQEHKQSRMIDFEPERLRQAAPKLLDALRWITCCPMIRGPVSTTAYIVSDERMAQAQVAIAEADAASIPSHPTVPALLPALNAVLPYAWNERASLRECWERDGDPKVKEELDACDRALDQATAAIAHVKAAGVPSKPAEVDVHSLLATRRQIASIWSIEDVQEVRPDLTDEQSWEVLQAAEKDHDANIGINWVVLRFHANWLHGDASQTDNAEECHE